VISLLDQSEIGTVAITTTSSPTDPALAGRNGQNAKTYRNQSMRRRYDLKQGRLSASGTHTDPGTNEYDIRLLRRPPIRNQIDRETARRS